jgi:hypothetical protein
MAKLKLHGSVVGAANYGTGLLAKVVFSSQAINKRLLPCVNRDKKLIYEFPNIKPPFHAQDSPINSSLLSGLRFSRPLTFLP